MSNVICPHATAQLIAYAAAYHGLIEDTTVKEFSYELLLINYKYLNYGVEVEDLIEPLEEYVLVPLEYEYNMDLQTYNCIHFFDYQIDWSQHTYKQLLKELEETIIDNMMEEITRDHKWKLDDFSEISLT